MQYRVKLNVFEGPLDLLLHLIKEQEIDIYDIPIAVITQQYLETLDLMKTLDLDIAGEYLVMAATLMLIKSRILLPKSEIPEEGEAEELVDPREELVRRLLEYKKYKDAAGSLRTMEEHQSRVYHRSLSGLPEEEQEYLEEVSIFDLLNAFQKLLAETGNPALKEISLDEISVTDKLNTILERLEQNPRLEFHQLFEPDRTRADLVATFLALLELVRLKLVRVAQPSFLGTIFLYKNPEEETNGSK